MIPKTIGKAASPWLFALMCAWIAFACAQTPDRSRVRASSRAAVVQAVDASDDSVAAAGGEPFKPVADACADSIANCGDPVKHLGTQNGCACFACGYGTPKQHSLCTRNSADKDALFKRAK